MLIKIKSLISFVNSHKKIVENYFFMTILQILNSLFYIIIYPYLIRVLGAEKYGLFIYITSIITYFIFLINFGFDLPATKAAASHINDKEELSIIFSSIFTAKLYLQITGFALLVLLIIFLPYFRENWILFMIIFAQSISHFLFPLWYFQGLQKMKVVTIIQVIFKFLTLPLIFIFVKSEADINIFAGINSSLVILGAVVSIFIVIVKDGIKIRLLKFSEVKIWFKESMPFFLSNSVGVIKEQGITILIGSFFGMRDVALFDLANKIVIIPRTLLMSLNAALFPKIVVSANRSLVRKIIKYEFFIGLFVVIAVILVGKPVIKLLGGESMISSYPLAIILSMSVITWLVVGAFISFVFIPSNNYYLVTKNQILALLSVFVFVIVGFLIEINIYVLVGALAFSGFVEIMFCLYVTYKKKLL